MTDRGEVTRLLDACAGGDGTAFDRLVAIVYEDLHRIAHNRLKHERSGHPLDTTALVHEAYLRLVPQATASWRDRAHFFAVASGVIRHVLVDYARRRRATRRSGGIRVPLRENTASTEPAQVELLDLEAALTRLGERDERLVRVVECRFFGGMSVPDTAEALGVSPRTVDRDWARAKAHLYRDLAGGGRSKERGDGEPQARPGDGT